MLARKKVTMQDIAEQAKVSLSTVSRVLSGSAPVAAEKQAAVLEAVRVLNYLPDPMARGLAGGLSLTIGVLTQNISAPLYDSILRGVLQGLEGSDYSPVFADGYWEREHEAKALRALLSRRVDGLIVLGGATSDAALVELSHQVPLIVVGRQVPALNGHCLFMDNFRGGYVATHHLIEMGHYRIAHITGILSHPDAVARREGYLAALADARLTADPHLLIEGAFTEQSGLLAVEMLLARGRSFSAIFAANDQTAYGVRLALARRGIRVPDDVSLVGFDDLPYSAYAMPPLTAIRQPAQEIGALAAQAMLRLLRGEPPDLPRVEVELLIRESVARAR